MSFKEWAEAQRAAAKDKADKQPTAAATAPKPVPQDAKAPVPPKA